MKIIKWHQYCNDVEELNCTGTVGVPIDATKDFIDKIVGGITDRIFNNYVLEPYHKRDFIEFAKRNDGRIVKTRTEWEDIKNEVS